MEAASRMTTERSIKMIYSVVLENGKTVTMDDEELKAYTKRRKEKQAQAENSESRKDQKQESPEK